MKTFGKFLAMSIFVVILLCAGLYLVLNNLGLMLTNDHTGLKYRWVSSGVEIKAGGLVENIQLEFPLSIRHYHGKWEIKDNSSVLTFDTIPRIKLTWKKLSLPVPKNNASKHPI